MIKLNENGLKREDNASRKPKKASIKHDVKNRTIEKIGKYLKITFKSPGD